MQGMDRPNTESPFALALILPQGAACTATKGPDARHGVAAGGCGIPTRTGGPSRAGAWKPPCNRRRPAPHRSGHRCLCLHLTGGCRCTRYPSIPPRTPSDTPFTASRTPTGTRPHTTSAVQVSSRPPEVPRRMHSAPPPTQTRPLSAGQVPHTRGTPLRAPGRPRYANQFPRIPKPHSVHIFALKAIKTTLITAIKYNIRINKSNSTSF